MANCMRHSIQADVAHDKSPQPHPPCMTINKPTTHASSSPQLPPCYCRTREIEQESNTQAIILYRDSGREVCILVPPNHTSRHPSVAFPVVVISISVRKYGWRAFTLTFALHMGGLGNPYPSRSSDICSANPDSTYTLLTVYSAVLCCAVKRNTRCTRAQP
ncbi:hypothetical protein DM02DRAFT_360577 [Periconia macrospinosa]|uniref:Uncharacterized protein n=1 Tax=Periconia macrospinosa TaxID=97972 RepID=A0A2V1DVS1_9PLEO|nr:hypothetical protein DM02DRAFT_360577 [Periconia macrospinosa]